MKYPYSQSCLVRALPRYIKRSRTMSDSVMRSRFVHRCYRQHEMMKYNMRSILRHKGLSEDALTEETSGAFDETSSPLQEGHP